MSTPVPPSTPVAQSAPSTPLTGTWRHPKYDEIVRRQKAAAFTSANVVKIAYNFLGWLLALSFGRTVWRFMPGLFNPGKALYPYANWVYWVLQMSFALNIIIACRPLFVAVDKFEDIPLTPAQRKLLGIPASSVPLTPGSHYSTPPKYTRTPTPLSGSPVAKGNYSNSPLSGKGSPNGGNLFSPNASTMLQKAMGGGMGGSRRASIGSQSPLGPSSSRINLLDTPSSPSPTKTGGGIALNSKWLYDKGRRNSGSTRLY
ncbi:hypothetical protein LZ554_008837 [Drepanopeziza brunnea f. sp. 'monogermtubi']|nr:hypothetical protein LZ554_008837 [Drepanopeziza brunnea f. sp. 'monogermtubi']